MVELAANLVILLLNALVLKDGPEVVVNITLMNVTQIHVWIMESVLILSMIISVSAHLDLLVHNVNMVNTKMIE